MSLLERWQVFRVHIVHRVQDVSANIAVFPVERLENFANFLALASVFGGTKIGGYWEISLLMKVTDGFGIKKGHGSNNSDFTYEERLVR